MKKHATSGATRNSAPLPIVLDSEVRVRVTPRGGRDAVIGIRAKDGVLLLRVSAPPVDGAANRGCIDLLAETLAAKKTQITLVGGETSRDKRFRIIGLAPEACDLRLALLPRVGDDSP